MAIECNECIVVRNNRGGIDVVFCPLHKAAPAMYEALKAAVEKLELHGRTYEKTIWACEQALAKLANETG